MTNPNSGFIPGMYVPETLEGFPDVMIVLDRECKACPFWVRIKLPNGCDVLNLPGEATLPGAVQAAERAGHSPTHFWETGSLYISGIPASVRRK